MCLCIKFLYNICWCILRAFDVELLYIAEQLNIPIKEVAITWHEVDGGLTNICVLCL